jgi:hypothetical protein
MTAPMTPTDAVLADWLREAPDRGSEEGLQAALAATRAVSQRPAWTFPGRWLPEAMSPEQIGGRRALPVLLVVGLLVLLAAAAVAFVVGSQHKLPPPFGFARNGAIAYDTGGGGGAYITGPNGRNPRRLAGDGIERQPTFSLDGTRIAYYSRPSDPLGATPPALPLPFHVFVANADGSNAHPIAGGATFVLYPFMPPAWSLDSRSVAFSADAGGVAQVWVVPIDGAAPAGPIISDGTARSSPAWSPNGKWIAMVEVRPGSPTANALVVARPDGSDRQTLHVQKSAGPEEGSFGETLSWSLDSTRIAYSRGRDPASHEQDGPQYLAIDTLGNAEDVVLHENSGWLRFPTWSLDARRLFFVVGDPSNAVLSMDMDTFRRTTVGQCAGSLGGPLQLSPDGRLLVNTCPGAPILQPAASATPDAEVVALPADAVRIDIQRLAP